VRSFKYIVVLIAFFGVSHLFSQTNKTRILFVLDGSQSMLGRWESEKKMDVAKRLLSKTVDSLKNVKNLELGLRVYGHQDYVGQGSKNCKDTKLEVPFTANNHNQIKSKLNEITPKGTTPIAYTLEQAANDFNDCKTCRNIIILITDGIEECGGDPCAISLAMQKNGVVFKPFIIGMGLDDIVKKSLRCVGDFYDTKDEASFQTVLGVIISRILDNTTVQVNLLDKYGKATETDVAMTFYDAQTGAIKYNFVHTFNDRGVSDTLPIDALTKYRIVAHTIPGVEKKDIAIQPGVHNIIGIDAPQGSLQLLVKGNNEYQDLKCIVRKKGESKTLHLQDFETTERYLIGQYDLEVLTLPRMYINAVDISQSHTTKVEIPEAGLATFFLTGKGVASIFLEEDGELKWVYNLKDNVSRSTLVMQPGKYRVIYKSANSKESIFTKEETFVISSGLSTQIKL
jgi:Ca-activated chloride channel family protein